MSLFKSLRCGNVRQAYFQLIGTGSFKEDAAQVRAVTALAQLSEKLLNRKPRENDAWVIFRPVVEKLEKSIDEIKAEKIVAEYTKNLARENAEMLFRKSGKFTPFLGGRVETDQGHVLVDLEISCPPAVELPMEKLSLYLVGSVGRGKTKLMDLFFENFSSSRAKRFHFADFMKYVHAEIGKRREPIDAVANSLATEFDLICLDELAISDIQDAVVFPRIVTILLKRNVALVITSNSSPQDLYPSGLNRHIYLPPLVGALRAGSRLINLDHGGVTEDFRRSKFQAAGKIFETEKDLEQFWEDLPDRLNLEIVNLSESRKLHFSVKGEWVMLEFSSLCCSDAFSEFDFVTLAEAVGNRKFLLSGVPEKFSGFEAENFAKRFGKFLEIFYDKRIFIALSLKSSEELFSEVLKKSRNFQETHAAAQRAISRLSQFH